MERSKMNLTDYKNRFLAIYDKAFFFDGTSTTLTAYYCIGVMPEIVYKKGTVTAKIRKSEINGFLTWELIRNHCRIFAPPKIEVGANIFLRRYAVYLLKEDDFLFGKGDKKLIPLILLKGDRSIKKRVIESIVALGFTEEDSLEFLKKYSNSIVIIIQENNGMSLEQIRQIPNAIGESAIKVLAISDEKIEKSLGYDWYFSRAYDSHGSVKDYFKDLMQHIYFYYMCSQNKVSEMSLLGNYFDNHLLIPSKHCLSFAISCVNNLVKHEAGNIYSVSEALIKQKINSFSIKEKTKTGISASIIAKDIECYLADYVLNCIFKKQNGDNIQKEMSSIPENGYIKIPYLKNSFLFKNGTLIKENLQTLMNDYFSFFDQFEISSSSFFSKGPELHLLYWIYYASSFIDTKQSATFIRYLNSLGSNGLFIPIMSMVLIDKCFASLPSEEATTQANKILNSFLSCREEQISLNERNGIFYHGKPIKYEEAYKELVCDFFESKGSDKYPSYLPKMELSIKNSLEEESNYYLKLFEDLLDSK